MRLMQIGPPLGEMAFQPLVRGAGQRRALTNGQQGVGERSSPPRQASDARLRMQEGDVLELAGDQWELRKVAPAQGERVAALVDDDRLPPAVLAIVLGAITRLPIVILDQSSSTRSVSLGAASADPVDLLDEVVGLLG